jgi:SAM-dependent methyltransferase
VISGLLQTPVVGPAVRCGWAAVRWTWHRLGRRAAIRRYLRRHPVPKLHLGAGSPDLADWLNTDLFPGRLALVRLDATRPFPLPGGTFHCVFAEHMIEHVSPDGARRMLAEAHRVLVSGGWIRIATPDLLQVVRLRAEPQAPDVQRYLAEVAGRHGLGPEPLRAARAVNGLFYGHGHRHLYDEETLAAELANAGFRDIARRRPGESGLESLRGLEQHHRVIGVGPNDYETLVLEARRA